MLVPEDVPVKLLAVRLPLSSMLAPLFWMVLPPVPLNLVIALSTELASPTTSPVPPTDPQTAVVPLDLRTSLLAPIGNLTALSAPVPTTMSPAASKIASVDTSPPDAASVACHSPSVSFQTIVCPSVAVVLRMSVSSCLCADTEPLVLEEDVPLFL